MLIKDLLLHFVPEPGSDREVRAEQSQPHDNIQQYTAPQNT